MQIGIVGKPSSGKSTFFSAATMADVPIAAYPFTTIESNKSFGFVRIECVEKEFDVKCKPKQGICVNGIRYVPVEMIDVAGLVPDAHKGKGMGTQFLDDLREADVLVHVIDASGSINEKGEAVEPGSYDPANDIEFLEKEIDYWFLGIIQKNWGKFSRTPFASKAKTIEAVAQNLSGLGIKERHVDTAFRDLEFSDKKLHDWNESELLKFATRLRELSKPIVIAANKIDLPNAQDKFERLKKQFPGKVIIPCSAEAELSLKKASKAGLVEYQAGNEKFVPKEGIEEKQQNALDLISEQVIKKYNGTGIQTILEDAVFQQLRYIAVFPVSDKKLTDSEGNVLPDALLLAPQSTALDLAFKLHTDIGKGFIKAVDVKTKQLVGKEHELKNRDVIEIVFKK